MVDNQRPNAARRGVGRVQEHVLPGHHVGIAVEADGGEDVFLAPGGP